MDNNHLLERMVKDIYQLLSDEDEKEALSGDFVLLWNGTKDLVKNGFNFAEYDDINPNERYVKEPAE